MAVHVKIQNIGPGQQNLLLKGMIVRNLMPRKVLLKRDGQERGVWTFTLRDSPCDFIKINVWGSFQYVQNLSGKFLINDLVEVSNGKAIFRQVKDGDESPFQPHSSCSFHLTINENQGNVKKATVNIEELIPLIAIPTKPLSQFFTISDILSSSEEARGKFVDVYSVIKDIEEKNEFVSKKGRKIERRDVLLTDQTYKVVRLTIWDSDLLKMTEKWKERNTVLYLADVRIDWSEFRQTATVSTTGRTIIIVDPNTTKAENLRKFMSSMPYQANTKLDQIVNKYTEPAAINSVMSCSGVIAKCKEEKQNSEFTALVYCLLESFHIDSNEDRLVIMKCNKCMGRVEPVCLDSNCPTAKGYEPFEAQEVYDIGVTLMDHSNFLTNCRLTNEVATQLIGFKLRVRLSERFTMVVRIWNMRAAKFLQFPLIIIRKYCPIGLPVP